jgi:hypothetical protein
MNTTIEAVLYTSKTLSNGQHPIMLRLTKNRKRKYISLHISLALQYWDAEKCKPRRNCPDKERIEALIQQKTQELQSQVMDFKTSDKEYTLNTLVEKASRKVVRQTVGEYLNGYIDRLLAEKRVGNAKTFQELRTSLTKFCRSLDFYFIDIDAEWLKRYEQWLRVERHYSDNSIGIRFRSLRVLYNSAITDGLIKKTDYPFDTFKVSRFKEATAKRSLTKEDIRRIMDCEVRTLTKYPKPFLQLAKDLFLFSYLSCGINLTDILHIRYADIVDGRLVFNRQKTGKLLSFQLRRPRHPRQVPPTERTSAGLCFPCFKAFCSHYGTTAVRTGATDEQADKSLSETNRRASAPAYHAHDIRCAALVRNCSEKVGSFDIHHFGIAGAQFGKDYANLPRFIRELADRCGHAKLIVRW